MSKFWKILVVILALLNAGLLATIWFKPGEKQKGEGGEPGRRPFNMIVEQLKMTDAQQKAYAQLRDNHHDSMMQLQAAGNKLRQAMFSNLKSGDAAQHTVDSLTNLIADNQKMIESVTYRHFAQVRALCTDEQKQKFDQVIGDVIKMMSAQGPHRREGPPPPGAQDGPPPPGENGPPPPPQQ